MIKHNLFVQKNHKLVTGFFGYRLELSNDTDKNVVFEIKIKRPYNKK